MGARRWLLALLLLVLLCQALGSASGGPVSEASDGKELVEGDTVNVVHPKVIRSAGGSGTMPGGGIAVLALVFHIKDPCLSSTGSRTAWE